MVISASSSAVKPDQDEQRVLLRYLRMGKEVLVELLITTEWPLTEQRKRWLTQQVEVHTWRLRAEAAETQVQDTQAKTSQQNY
ncbi:hypothetical protein [Dictyobacter formicarum]|uniref:Uncharacterized protein n=1 Tax=Dictyobacter formicarum TaxID=2778368 RepID=A0ABQ3V8V9_9CHLR|nr:hypothetical protein [Dictyobacter formicarum]GHO82327.1 hypothetical protein KSZ_03330 [Dictyobacter formicarum]